MCWKIFGRNRKYTANVSPPLIAPLPTRPPVSGEYGRLDSPWRVRSHLETLGQPKAGTVTITRPQSLWALAYWQCNEKKLRRWDSTGKVVGLRRRGLCVTINGQRWAKKLKAVRLLHLVGSLWPKTGLSCWVNGVESSANTPNYAVNWNWSSVLPEINQIRKKVETRPLLVSGGCDEYIKSSNIKQSRDLPKYLKA